MNLNITYLIFTKTEAYPGQSSNDGVIIDRNTTNNLLCSPSAMGVANSFVNTPLQRIRRLCDLLGFNDNFGMGSMEGT